MFYMLAFAVCVTLTCQLGVTVHVFHYLCSLLIGKTKPEGSMIQGVIIIIIKPEGSLNLIHGTCALGIHPVRREAKQSALLLCNTTFLYYP